MLALAASAPTGCLAPRRGDASARRRVVAAAAAERGGFATAAAWPHSAGSESGNAGPGACWRSLVGGLAALSVLLSPAPASAAEPGAAAAVPQLSPAERFGASCAGCHAGGGNVIGGSSLAGAELTANGLGSVEPLAAFIASGRGKMPGFGVGCTPKGACTFGPRLSDAEIAQLAGYVLDRAAAGWK